MGSHPLVAIVPNFSEGRRADVIDAIVRALLVPGVTLASRHADPDHNRLDCTLLGEPEAVRASALAGAAKAVELIDMERHSGSHPRIGAVDVVPFVPVRNVSMQRCVELARGFARELADRLELPVYLYGEAALVPERRNLADVRRGEYEGLRVDVEAGRRPPDLGPRRIGRAGAVAVGARNPLVAFNVYLSGTEQQAKEIAGVVREAGGGLPAVRAIGFAVTERGVTVSMNLLDHEVTRPRRAFDAVAAEAAARGMEVLSSEIVGLVPEAALAEGDVEHLRLGGFDAYEQILERIVIRAERSMRSMPVEAFLERLASSEATPGGGAAAALSGATGAALVAMVARLTAGKEDFAAVDDRMRAAEREADEARERFLELADRDVAAFDAVMAAFRLPKEEQGRAVEIQRALTGAAEEPLEIARLAVRLIHVAAEVTESGDPQAASDGLSAAHALAAAVGGAAANVVINAASLKDTARAEALRAEVAELRARSAELLHRADEAFARRV